MFKDNKKLVAETIFIKEALKENLSLNEFLLLLYFDNSFDLVFDIKVVAKTLNMSEEQVLEAYSNLMKKKLIKVKAEKDGYGKVIEKVCLDNFYNEIKTDVKNSEIESSKEDIFSIFESNFGRSLSPMDYEIINAWIDRGFSEELVIAALNEAVYNGVPNLRYIDKVLYDWNKKGYKTVEDVNNRFKEDKQNDKLFETSVLNFDWLNEK
ncbi:MAG TPA: DnaD domain protein [Candidatus Onthocola stercoravium]|nr:DnaD domain protein [Candidatus Onthocola stercoravium]